MDILNFLWTELTWWQLSLLAIYTLYTLFTSFHIHDYIDGFGFVKGTRHMYTNHKDELLLYHIIFFIINIPAYLLGSTFPFFKKVFAIKIFKFKKETK